MIKIILAILLLLSAGPSFAQGLLPDVTTAELSARLAATPPDALQKLVVMWSDNNHPIFTARRICFEALAEAKKSDAIDPAITACERAATLARTPTLKFIASILDAVNTPHVPRIDK